MLRVVLVCDGVAEAEGLEAASDIAREFNEQRGPRYQHAACLFEAGTLWLSCENDGWDADGLNLMDEFSDCICAYLKSSPEGGMRFVSATKNEDAS